MSGSPRSSKTGAPLAFKESSTTPLLFLPDTNGAVKRKSGESFRAAGEAASSAEAGNVSQNPLKTPGKDTFVLVSLASVDFVFISI